MNAKTLEAVTRHGKALLAAFPNTTEQDPVALCKKLRRIETAVSRVTLQACNEGMDDQELDAATDKAEARVKALLGLSDAKAEEVGLFVNRDPRGYALKLSDTWIGGYNRHAEMRIHSDWGGYGILAPDLTI